MGSDRRRFLESGLAALTAALVPPLAYGRQAGGFFDRHALAIGLQLYTVADAVRGDLDGALAKIAHIGYRAVEPAGFHGHEPAKLRAAFDRAGLRCMSIHIQGKGSGNEPALDGDIARVAADVHALGASQVVMPMFLSPVANGDDWRRTAEFLNEKGAALQRLMHVKDIRDTTRTNFAFKQDPTEVGRGMLKWKTLLPAAHAAGVRHFYVEQEPPFEHDRFDAIAASYTYLANQV